LAWQKRATSDQVLGARNFKSEVETSMAALELRTYVTALELETDTTPLELDIDMAPLVFETETDVSQEILK
jgi:hypothetical protein